MCIFKAKPSLLQASKECLYLPPFPIELKGAWLLAVGDNRDELIFFIRPSCAEINVFPPQGSFCIFHFFPEGQPAEKDVHWQYTFEQAVVTNTQKKKEYLDHPAIESTPLPQTLDHRGDNQCFQPQ